MELFHRILGTGKPLFILHGVYGTSDNLYTIGKQLSEKYQVILVDQRNHGQSPHSHDWNYKLMSSDLNKLFIELNVSKAIVIGHSMGGKTAMQFAYDYPEKVSDLVVVDIGPKYYKPHHEEIIAGLKSIDIAALKSRGEADEKLSETLDDFGVRQFLLKNLARNKDGSYKWMMNLKVISDNIEEVGKELPNEIKNEDLSGIEKRFPKYHLETIADAGHWVHAEQPEAFFEVLSKYLTDNND
jgi:pimeloyl-ACP methyl ester carboxylesterase